MQRVQKKQHLNSRVNTGPFSAERTLTGCKLGLDCIDKKYCMAELQLCDMLHEQCAQYRLFSSPLVGLLSDCGSLFCVL